MISKVEPGQKILADHINGIIDAVKGETNISPDFSFTHTDKGIQIVSNTLGVLDEVDVPQIFDAEPVFNGWSRFAFNLGGNLDSLLDSVEIIDSEGNRIQIENAAIVYENSKASPEGDQISGYLLEDEDWDTNGGDGCNGYVSTKIESLENPVFLQVWTSDEDSSLNTLVITNSSDDDSIKSVLESLLDSADSDLELFHTVKIVEKTRIEDSDGNQVFGSFVQHHKGPLLISTSKKVVPNERFLLKGSIAGKFEGDVQKYKWSVSVFNQEAQIGDTEKTYDTGVSYNGLPLTDNTSKEKINEGWIELSSSGDDWTTDVPEEVPVYLNVSLEFDEDEVSGSFNVETSSQDQSFRKPQSETDKGMLKTSYCIGSVSFEKELLKVETTQLLIGHQSFVDVSSPSSTPSSSTPDRTPFHLIKDDSITGFGNQVIAWERRFFTPVLDSIELPTQKTGDQWIVLEITHPSIDNYYAQWTVPHGRIYVTTTDPFPCLNEQDYLTTCPLYKLDYKGTTVLEDYRPITLNLPLYR